jgi:subtilase family serine protease
MTRSRKTALSMAAAALFLSPLAALALSSHNVPRAVAIADYQGRVDPAKEMNLTIVLKMHDPAGFDKAVADLYDPASPRFHQWFTEKDFEKYAPTPQEFETVKSELEKQGFTVLSSDPRRFSIRVHGTAATVEKAFQTELGMFSYQGRTFQSYTRDAHLAGPADDLIEGVCGLERHQSQPQLSYLKDPRTGEPVTKKRIDSKESLTAFLNSFTDTPLSTSVPDAFTTPGAALPKATYTGMQYGFNGKSGGFTPAELEAHYGLTSLLSEGYDGAGETIALVEGYGYPTMEADANASASAFHLPALTTKNFSVVYPEGKPLNPNGAALTGWDVEIALDIQSAHATAPGAKILVVASSGQDNEDQINSLSYIEARDGSTTPLAHAVSNSWENDAEIIAGELEEEAFNSVLKLGAAAGIAFQFSSGDGGDQGLGTPVGAVSVPSNSPYVTSVGGTSVLNNPYGTGQVVTGWGMTVSELYLFEIVDPLEGYFSSGAGGGVSQYYAKPSWQEKLTGTWRKVPDVSAVADPATGFPVILTEDGQQSGEIVGGTSLASPVFTATWAIADQWNGTPLGQAAPAISKLSAGEITDVVPPGPSLYNDLIKYDTTGKIVDKSGTHTFTASTLYTDAENIDEVGTNLSLYSTTDFLSVIWDVPGDDNGVYIAFTFNADSSLTVEQGWDDVTGWGEPNGEPFIQGVTGKQTGAPLKGK